MFRPISASPTPADSGLVVPEALEQRYRLFSRELGAGTLNRLLLLHAVMASSLRVSRLRVRAVLGTVPSCLACALALGGTGPSREKRELRNPTNQAA